VSARAAIALAEHGFHVLFLSGKIPHSRLAPHGVDSATCLGPAVRAFARQAEDLNVGIAAGVGALTSVAIVDVDPRNGGDVMMDGIYLAHGPLPRTVRARSGRGDGGEHIYLRWPTVGSYRGKLGQGVDLLRRGKYVVAPPSIHPDSGEPYTWVHSPFDTPIADAPDWLVDLAREIEMPRIARPQVSGGPKYARAALDSEYQRLASIGAGNRNNALNVAALKLARFVRTGELGETDIVETLVSAASIAGLKGPEVRRTIRSGLRAGMSR
jgi:hypothetical protein